jgi:hypothetical protein
MSGVIYVSGNLKKPKVKRGRPAKAPSKGKPRKSTASSGRSRSRSIASSPTAASDVEDSESIAQNNMTGDGNVEQLEDYDLMEEESVHFDDSDSEEEIDESKEPNNQDAAPATNSRTKVKETKTRRAAGPPPMETFINQTAFDVYFSYASSKMRISNNVLSSLIVPLTHEEVHSLGHQMQTHAGKDQAIKRLCKSHT